MKIKVLGAAGGEVPGQKLTGFLIDEDILLDAGTICQELTPAEQRKIRHVLITHAHLDHIHALPFLLDNLIGRVDYPISVYGHPDVLNAIQQHIFNGRIWPDFAVLPTPEKPILRLLPVEPGRAFTLGSYTVEPVLAKHSFAAYAYILTAASGSVIFTGDTAPSEDMWDKIGKLGKVHMAFVECSFSNQRQDMARMTFHLCPADIAAGLAKTGHGADIPVRLYHIKPDYFQPISEEIKELPPLRVGIARTGDVLEF